MKNMVYSFENGVSWREVSSFVFDLVFGDSDFNRVEVDFFDASGKKSVCGYVLYPEDIEFYSLQGVQTVISWLFNEDLEDWDNTDDFFSFFASCQHIEERLAKGESIQIVKFVD